MKNENLFYAISTLVIIVGASLKILHWPYGGLIVSIGFLGGFLFQGIHITRLKKRITELENKSKE